MRTMNELAVTTAEERFSSLRHPSHHQHSHGLPPTPPTDAATDPTPTITAAASASATTTNVKSKSKSKPNTRGIDGSIHAGVEDVVGEVLTADQEVVHKPILVDDNTLSDKAAREMETDTLSPLLGETILAAREMETDTLSPLLGESILATWGDGEGVSVVAGSITPHTDATHATTVTVKDDAVPLGNVEMGVEDGMVASASVVGVTKKKKTVLMASSPSVQLHSPSLSIIIPKTAVVPVVQGVCRLEMERIRRQVKHRQSTHHLTAIAKHLWFVSFVLKLQETTSLSHQEIPPRLVDSYLLITLNLSVIFLLFSPSFLSLFIFIAIHYHCNSRRNQLFSIPRDHSSFIDPRICSSFGHRIVL